MYYKHTNIYICFLLLYIQEHRHTIILAGLIKCYHNSIGPSRWLQDFRELDTQHGKFVLKYVHFVNYRIYFMFLLTLGCNTVSLIIIIGGGSVMEWPTMVGPKTLDRFIKSILQSGLFITLQRNISVKGICMQRSQQLANIQAKQPKYIL